MFSYSSWHTTPNQFDRKNLKVARKATVPVLLYCILAIVTEHLADADSLFRQQKEPVYTKYHHINSPKLNHREALLIKSRKESYHENRADH